MVNQCSLRQHDLDQVLRVERFTLLSACSFTGTPFSCSFSYMSCRLFCQYKNQPASWLIPNSPNPAFPFFLHLQFAGAYTRIEREKVREQTVKFDGLIDHREMTGTIQ